MNGNGHIGQLLSHLPGVYQSSDDLRDFLAPFETVLLGDAADGVVEPEREALEKKIGKIFKYFDPAETPDEFLPWLEQWVALSYTSGLSPARRRRLLAEIVPLYATRGTKAYLSTVLQYYTPDGSEITINDGEFRGLEIGNAYVGRDSWLEKERPFYFQVRVRVPRSAGLSGEQQEKLAAQDKERARSVIDLAKPAHTDYDLDWSFFDFPNAEPELGISATGAGEVDDDC